MQRHESTQIIIIFMFALTLFLSPSPVKAGSILSSHKYAWSNNVGYVNFENVIVNDNALSGYAWSTNTGFINFAPAQSGVLNDGTGNLSGFAWGEGLGYIDFDNVSINPTTGLFSGTATGEVVGVITFDCPNYCDVETDWRKNNSPTIFLSHIGRRTILPEVSIPIVNSNNPLVPNVSSSPNIVAVSVGLPDTGDLSADNKTELDSPMTSGEQSVPVVAESPVAEERKIPDHPLRDLIIYGSFSLAVGILFFILKMNRRI